MFVLSLCIDRAAKSISMLIQGEFCRRKRKRSSILVGVDL